MCTTHHFEKPYKANPVICQVQPPNTIWPYRSVNVPTWITLFYSILKSGSQSIQLINSKCQGNLFSRLGDKFGFFFTTSKGWFFTKPRYYHYTSTSEWKSLKILECHNIKVKVILQFTRKATAFMKFLMAWRLNHSFETKMPRRLSSNWQKL